MTAVGSEATFGDDGDVLYLDSGDGYMTVYMFKTSSNYTLQKKKFYYVQIIPQ